MVTKSNKIGKALAKGTAITFLLRLFSFFLTQVTIRLIDPVALGQASIQLELILTTCLFVGREGFRLTFMKIKSDSLKNESIINTVWCSIPAGIIMTIAVGYFCFIRSSQKAISSDYEMAAMLYSLSVVLETLSEPLAIFCICTHDVESRAKAEGMAAFSKSIFSVIFLSFLPYFPISAMGLSQLIYSSTLTLVLYFKKWDAVPFPSSFTKLNNAALYSIFIYTCQGVFKHILTEGDRIVLSIISNDYSRGIYAMVTSYGGIVSRLLFQPFEENARIYFAASSSTNSIKSFTTLTKCILYIGFLFACVASRYTRLLLELIAGRKWLGNNEAYEALSMFCIYILLLAWNGITEAFVFGVMTEKDVWKIGFYHALVGIVFFISSPILVQHYQTSGLIMANILCMLLRCCYSMYFASQYFKTNIFSLLVQIMPHLTISSMFLLTFFLASSEHKDLVVFSQEWIVWNSQHVSIGVSCLVVIISMFINLEKEFIMNVKFILKDEKKQD